jgi:aryl-alcohol dehydrogenase-like predicted oxidoreductase
METGTLGSNLEVSAPGFGCMNIAWAYGLTTNKEDAVRLFRAAYESSATFFIGANFGTSSAGTHGNAPPRENQ